MREDDEDDVDELYARMIERVKRKRRLAEIESMKEELAGGDPTNPVEIEGTTLPARKRTAVLGSDGTLLKHMKPGELPHFSGKSVKELQTYVTGWKNYFRALEPVADDAYERRIAFAATHLKGTAAQAWERNEKSYYKWDEYHLFLKGVVADPAVRKSEALVQIAAKRQGDKQSVRELLAEIENLEQDIPPMTDEERRAWTLLNALKPALRTEVIRENREITSREAILISAQRHEEILKHQAKSESQPSQSASSKRGAGASRTKSTTSAGKAPKDERRTKEKTSSTSSLTLFSNTLEDSYFNYSKKSY